MSSSIACLPIITRSGLILLHIDVRILATDNGSSLDMQFTKIPESAPIAKAFLMVSCTSGKPMDTAIISLATPFSFNRRASSTAISSKGFIDIFTLSNSTSVSSFLTRTLTL